MWISSEILDKTIEMNEQTTKQVEAHIQYIEKRLIKWKSLPVEQQALEILKEYYLVEAPIPDENWGGAIRKFGNGSMVPIINTAQPRLYQYFIYWHEVYHLTEQAELDTHKEKNYEITAEFDLNERKADYFASQMIFRYMDLYDYFHSLRFDDFLVNVAHCMKSFKAPYKAILIELYQIAKKNRNEQLQFQIKHYFDQRLTIKEWSAIFQEYSLDDTLIKPSLVINLSSIKQVIKNEINQHPDVELYKDNLELVRGWEEKYKAIQRELKERFDG